MTVFFNDGYELGRLKALHWADPADTELRMRIAALEAELALLNRNGGGS
jgi:hypothetical protein